MRKITFETDYNHKLDSDTFVHVTQVMAPSIPESSLVEPIQLVVLDNPARLMTVKVVDFHRLPLCKLVNAYTLPSHGLYATDFIEWYLNRYPTATPDTTMAVYFFKKVS